MLDWVRPLPRGRGSVKPIPSRARKQAVLDPCPYGRITDRLLLTSRCMFDYASLLAGHATCIENRLPDHRRVLVCTSSKHADAQRDEGCAAESGSGRLSG